MKTQVLMALLGAASAADVTANGTKADVTACDAHGKSCAYNTCNVLDTKTKKWSEQSWASKQKACDDFVGKAANCRYTGNDCDYAVCNSEDAKTKVWSAESWATGKDKQAKCDDFVGDDANCENKGQNCSYDVCNSEDTKTKVWSAKSWATGAHKQAKCDDFVGDDANCQYKGQNCSYDVCNSEDAKTKVWSAKSWATGAHKQAKCDDFVGDDANCRYKGQGCDYDVCNHDVKGTWKKQTWADSQSKCHDHIGQKQNCDVKGQGCTYDQCNPGGKAVVDTGKDKVSADMFDSCVTVCKDYSNWGDNKQCYKDNASNNCQYAGTGCDAAICKDHNQKSWDALPKPAAADDTDKKDWDNYYWSEQCNWHSEHTRHQDATMTTAEWDALKKHDTDQQTHWETQITDTEKKVKSALSTKDSSCDKTKKGYTKATCEKDTKAWNTAVSNHANAIKEHNRYTSAIASNNAYATEWDNQNRWHKGDLHNDDEAATKKVTEHDKKELAAHPKDAHLKTYVDEDNAHWDKLKENHVAAPAALSKKQDNMKGHKADAAAAEKNIKKIEADQKANHCDEAANKDDAVCKQLEADLKANKADLATQQKWIKANSGSAAGVIIGCSVGGAAVLGGAGYMYHKKKNAASAEFDDSYAVYEEML